MRTAPSTNEATPVNTRLASYNDDDYFGHQQTTKEDLPDPAPLVENMARSVIEILAGARELEQISRWVTDDVYRSLLVRVQAAQRARALKKIAVHRPNISLGKAMVRFPTDYAAECVVVVHGRGRSRSVAMRLEGIDRRWRATAIHVL